MDNVPSILASIASWTGISKICLCLQTSTTLLNFCCTSFVAPLYANAVASAMTGLKANRKSSLRRAFDCCATSMMPEVISKQTPTAYSPVDSMNEAMFSGIAKVAYHLQDKSS